ncbi:MAG: hotdog fold thioesterase [Cytophagales bacterium]|nr:hotdog fold thioesterase [Cytophagales bacterium]
MLFPSYVTLDKLNTINKGNLAGHLGIEYIDIGPDYLRGRMPVNEKTKQPLGLLHGGASAAFAETMGSVAANAVVDQNKFYCVGIEINANHVRRVTDSYVYAVTKPAHIGRTTHVWEIRITNEKKQLVCTSRLTVAVIERKE